VDNRTCLEEFSLLYLLFLNGTLSFSETKRVRKREREVGGAATKASRGALSVTKQESLEITNATIVTYEQHIAWQEKPRGTQRASVLVDPSDPRCFVLVCQSRVGRGPLGSPDPKPRNMPTQCGMDISPEALPSQNSPVRCCTATPNFRRGTRYSSCRWTESAAFPPFFVFLVEMFERAVVNNFDDALY